MLNPPLNKSRPRALPLALRSLRSQWRQPDVLLLVAALAVAVAAASAVGLFTDRIRAAMVQQGGEAIAADLRMNLRAPLSAERQQLAEQSGVASAEIIEFASVALAGDESSLVSVKAVDASYPLRGELIVAGDNGPQPTRDGPTAGSVWLERRAAQQLAVALGDTLQLGSQAFTVSRELLLEPDRSNGFMTLAPRLMMNRSDVESTGLLRMGSRASYRALFAGSAEAITTLREALAADLAVGEELQSPAEAQPALKRSLDRADVFLDLAALVAVILAGIATAMAAGLHASRRMDEVALMKSLGAPQGLIVRLLAWQLLLLAVIGTALGLLGGIAAQGALSSAIGALLDMPLPSPSITAVLPAIVTGIVLLFGFAWPRLSQAQSAPPSRVFQQAAALPGSRYGLYLIAVAAVAGLVLWQARSVSLAAIVLLGSAVAAAVLWLAARLLLLLLAAVANSSGGKISGSQLGIKSLLRRPAQNSWLITAFGTGLTALFLLIVVRTDLLERWQQQTPEDAPNRFLVNIGPEQTGDIEQWLKQNGIATERLYPMVRARLTQVNKQPVTAADFDEDRAGELLTRELNLSWERAENNDDELLSGRLWTAEESAAPLVSVEESVAKRLNLQLGDTLGFDVAGETFAAVVQSVRKVDWGSMQANFYLLFPPEFLTPYPATYITSLYVTGNQQQQLVGLVKEFPNVSVLDLDAILGQLRRIVDRVSLAVEVVFGFTLLAGVLVLLAAVQGSRAERRREAAVLRVLGGTSRMLRRAAITEFLLVGLAAALLAALAAQLTAGLIASRVLELPMQINFALWGIAIAVAATGITLVGILSLRDVLNQPPSATLKQSH